MSAFHFLPLAPHALLRPYIDKMWIFESSGRLPEMDNKLIVPNGNLKLAFTSRNGLTASVNKKTFVQKENELSLTGIVESGVMLNPNEDEATETIGVEFNPLGAYRLFHLSYAEVGNRIFDMGDLLGKKAEEIKRRLADAETKRQKLDVLQNFLISQLEQAVPDPIYDYCINKISCKKGLITIKELERQTGYTARWLNRKFNEHLGISPKALAEIVRFKQVYEAYTAGGQIRDHIYDYYYDQSHFLRVFKRMTGFNPTELAKSENGLATKHYAR